MTDYQRLQHTVWECKYHVVFVPKYRRKALFTALRKELGPMFHELARRQGCRVEEGHLRPDHVHMLLSIPPKYSVAAIVGYLKGRVRFILPGRIGARNATSPASTSGRGAISCRPSAPMKAESGRTSGTRSKRTFGSINSSCLSRT